MWAEKIIPGDIVSTKDTRQYKVSWVNYNDNEAGILTLETPYGSMEGKVVKLDELQLICPALYKMRTAKPITEMDKTELIDYVRILRQARVEVFSTKTKTKRVKRNRTTSRKKDKKAEFANLMGEDFMRALKEHASKKEEEE